MVNSHSPNSLAFPEEGRGNGCLHDLWTVLLDTQWIGSWFVHTGVLTMIITCIGNRTSTLCFNSHCGGSTCQAGTFTANSWCWHRVKPVSVRFPHSRTACYGCRMGALSVVEENWDAQTRPPVGEKRVRSHHSSVHDVEGCVILDFVEADAPRVERWWRLLRVVLPRQNSVARGLNLDRQNGRNRMCSLFACRKNLLLLLSKIYRSTLIELRHSAYLPLVNCSCLTAFVG